MKLGDEGDVCGIREYRLLVQQGQDTRWSFLKSTMLQTISKIVATYTFNKINGSLWIHSEINEGPIYPLLFVFLLLECKHVMVEELLELLIGEVNAQLQNIYVSIFFPSFTSSNAYLLEAISLENLKTSNIQYTNEGRAFFLRQYEINLLHNPEEKAMVNLISTQNKKRHKWEN